MSLRVNDVVAALALAAVASAAQGARADEVGFGQHQWVPSLAVTGGATMQDQSGSHASFQYDAEAADPTQATTLREPDFGEDRAVSPFIGGAIELMTPSVWRLRFFASGEVLPVFAPERHLTDEGQPTRISGPEVNSVIAKQEDNTHFTDPPTQPRANPFGASDAKGQGIRSNAQVDQLSYGAKAGLAFSFQYRGRQMRIKPSVGWYRYKVGVKGYMVHPACNPANRCTNTYNTSGVLLQPGFLREAILKASDNGVFDGVGPGLDLEMDAGRFGPIGTSLFIGVGGYYIPGDRDIDFGARKTFNPGAPDFDQLGADTYTVTWHTRVAPWIYRGSIGVRFQWLGLSD
jgi:hypothetical protein